MCGIAGFVGFPNTDPASLAEQMRRAIRFRGLDAEAEWIGAGVRFLHSRLSIIALGDDGAQPMEDRSGRYVITYNGEIYNYLELRRTYEQMGAQFRTASDTEIILEGFRLKGPKVCDDLNGMFAFAIWDRLERRLFLGRDRLGKKPLYYAELGGVLYFSSTIDALHAAPGWTGTLSASAIDCYRAIGGFAPGRTVFHQVRTLPPGAYATYAAGRAIDVTTYWRPDFSNKRTIGLDQALDEFEELLSDAIDIRLRADVPVALTFSGGADSGLIAALAKHRLNRPLACWTLDYDAPDDRSEEKAIAERTAQILGLDWHYINFNYYNDLVPALQNVLRFFDQPCNNMSVAYSLPLYEAMRPHSTVVLTGNGSDELFLGYNSNEEFVARDLAEQGPSLSWLRRMLPSAPKPVPVDVGAEQSDYLRHSLRGRADTAETEQIVHDIAESIRASNVATRADLYSFMSLGYYTTDGNFRLPDIAGLAAQVEARSPFLDHRIYEFAARLPSNLKVADASSPATNKYLVKKCYERYVPADIAWASKKGMCANLKWPLDMAHNPRWDAIHAEQLKAIGDAGLETEDFATSWREYRAEKKAGVPHPTSAGMAMSGLMLGFWMTRQKSLAQGMLAATEAA